MISMELIQLFIYTKVVRKIVSKRKRESGKDLASSFLQCQQVLCNAIADHTHADILIHTITHTHRHTLWSSIERISHLTHTHTHIQAHKHTHTPTHTHIHTLMTFSISSKSKDNVLCFLSQNCSMLVNSRPKSLL